MTWSAQDVVLIIGAFAALLTTVGTFIISMVTLVRQGRLTVQQEVIHTLVNSQSEKLNAAIKAGALAEGRIAGKLEERANPMISAGIPASASPPPQQPIVVQMPEQPSPLPVVVVDPDGKPSKPEPKKS